MESWQVSKMTHMTLLQKSVIKLPIAPNAGAVMKGTFNPLKAPKVSQQRRQVILLH
jgi:hypothetical protein